MGEWLNRFNLFYIIRNYIFTLRTVYLQRLAPSALRSPPYDKSTSNRWRSSCFLYLSWRDSRSYGAEQGACAFLKNTVCFFINGERLSLCIIWRLAHPEMIGSGFSFFQRH